MIAYSQDQQRIMDFVDKYHDNLIINALAGSGKTFILIEITKQLVKLDIRPYIMAFNTRIKDEMNERLRAQLNSDYQKVRVSTTYSAGYSLLRRKISNLNVDNFKYHRLVSDTLKSDSQDGNLTEIIKSVKRMVNLVRLTLTDPDKSHEVLLLAEDHGIYDFNENHVSVLQSVINQGKKVMEETGAIDFVDQIYWPVRYDIHPKRTYPVIMVDELQDLNNAQWAIVKRYLDDPEGDGQFIGVGDERQALYLWAGAGSNMMDDIRVEINADTMSLPTCYRCSKKVIEEAQKWVPEIKYREDAPEGSVQRILKTNFYDAVQASDAVICRFIAPLVEIYAELLKRGKRGCIRGQKIAEDLISTINEIAKVHFPLTEFLNHLHIWHTKKLSALSNDGKKEVADTTKQKLKQIVEVLEMCHRYLGAVSMSDFVLKIKAVFSEETNAIALMTIHTAKGLEWENVYAIGYDDLPYIHEGQTPDSLQQEKNAAYVMVTRAKTNFYIASETVPEKKKEEPKEIKPKIQTTVHDPLMEAINWENDEHGLIWNKIAVQFSHRKRSSNFVDAYNWRKAQERKLNELRNPKQKEETKQKLPEVLQKLQKLTLDFGGLEDE